MKILKSSIIGLIVLFVIAAISTATLIIKQNMIDIVINDNISPVIQNVKYRTPVKTEWMPIVANDKLLTPTTKGVLDELKEQFPAYEVGLYKNLKNSELIDMIYTSLSKSMPVFCLIALDEAEAVRVCMVAEVAELDIFGDRVALGDPYGEITIYSVRDFLKATRFDPYYAHMDLFMKLKFALEIFSKNTIFTLRQNLG